MADKNFKVKNGIDAGDDSSIGGDLTVTGNIVSPTLTGTPTAPTAAAGTNTTQIATTAFVSVAVSDLVDSAPTTLDTLNELAAALGDDPNFATTVTNSLATKAPLASPALTGTPTAPTAAAGTNTTQIATTAFVNSEITNDVTTAFVNALNVNADTVDSLHATSFIRSDVNDTATGTITMTADTPINFTSTGDTPKLDASTTNKMWLDGFVAIPKGYAGGDGLTFRFDDSDTAYIFDSNSGTALTINAGTSPPSGSIERMFGYTNSYTNINTYKDGSNNFEFEVTGISVNNSSNTRWAPYVLFHSVGTAVTTCIVEGLQGDGTTWTELYNGDCRDVIAPRNYTTFSTGILKGLRFKFQGITGNSYLKMVGATSTTSPSFGWQMLKDGGSFYGEISGKDAGTEYWSLTNDGQLDLKKTFDSTDAAVGSINLMAGSGNFIYYQAAGVAGPTTTTRSAGTKAVWYPSLSSSLVDYATGITGNTLWNSVPGSSQQFAWYAGTTEIATLNGSGDLAIDGDLTVSGAVVSPALTGTPTAPTAAAGTNTTQLATTAFVQSEMAAAGLGDVLKVGTPVDNQVGVWTGDGTIEGAANLTYDGTTLDVDRNAGAASSTNAAKFVDGTYGINFVPRAVAGSFATGVSADDALIYYSKTAANTGFLSIAPWNSSNRTFRMGHDGTFTWEGNDIYHAGNDGAGSGLDADLLRGYGLSSGTAPDTVVSRNSTGDFSGRYIYCSYLNTNHAASTRSSDTVFYSSTDNFVRKNDATGMRAALDVPHLAGTNTFTGTNSFTGTVDISTDLTFEGAKHRISINDGGGNIQWRFAHDYGDTNVGYTCTEAGYTGIIQFNQATGIMEIGPNSASSLAAGATFAESTSGLLAINPASIRYGGNLIWHAGNDGAGSGLDADMLDGIQSSSFVRSDAADTLSGQLTTTGGIKITNGPSTIAGVAFDNGWLQVGNSSLGWTLDSNEMYVAGSCQMGALSGGTLTITDGAGTLIISDARVENSDLRDAVVIDNQIFNFGTGNDFRMFHTGAHMYMDMYLGNLYIRDGTTTRFTFDRTSGDFTATGNVTAYSDGRLKKNVVDLESMSDKVNDLRPVRYDRKDINKHEFGFIAQELKEVLPEVVIEGDDGVLSVDYGKLATVAIKAIQEQQSQIDELREMIRGLTK